MIRYLTILLLFMHFSFCLTSCSTEPSSSDQDGISGPLDDDDGGAASLGGGGNDDPLGGADDNGSEANKSGDLSGGEDLLESEMEEGSSGKSAKSATAETKQDDLDTELDADLGDKISDSDLEPAPPNAKEANPPEPSLIESAPGQAEEAGPVVPAPVPPTETTPAETEEKARVRDIRYVSNPNGGTVVIETTKPITYQTRLNAATQQFVIEMADVELPAALQRPYLTRDFNSRIGSINAYQGSGSATARVVIQLNGKSDGEPVVQQEGTSLVVIPPAAPVIAEQAPQPPAQSSAAPAEKSPPQGALSAHTLDEFLTGNQKFYGRPISLQVKDADVRDVVNFLAEESGANIVMSDDVKGRISIKLRRVPWDQALVTVMRTKDLGYVRQGNVLRISTLKALQGETEAANKIIEAQKAIVPSVVQIIPVSYASLDDLVKNLASFLSKDGKVVSDNRSNSLIVTDKAEVVDRIQKLVKNLDIPPAQVSIEAKIVEAIEDFSSFLGISWNFGGAPVTLSQAGGAQGAPVNMNLQGNGVGVSNVSTGLPATTSISFGTLDVLGNLSASLVLAERESLAKVISAPRISTMNREKSTITQKGENVTIQATKSETTGAVTKQEKRTPFTLQLDVTPQITPDGAVIMELDVKREYLGGVVDAELGTRPVNARSAHSKILVQTGQTAVIGGIYTSDQSEATYGIPGLMNIPVLGWLFKSKTSTREKNELLIFLTPRILAQQEKGQAVTQQ